MRGRWVACLAFALVLSGCDWPMFMQNAAHTGASADTSISVGDVANGPSEAWRANLGAFAQESITSSPVVANGTVYVGTSDGQVMAFSANGSTNCSGSAPKTCLPLWSTGATTQAITSTPAVVGGVVYVGTESGVVEAFDAAGSIDCFGTPKVCFPIWSSAPIGAIKTSPVVVNGHVFVAANHSVFEFDAVGNTSCSGSCAYTFEYRTSSTVLSSPALANDTLYFGSDDHTSTRSTQPGGRAATR